MRSMPGSQVLHLCLGLCLGLTGSAVAGDADPEEVDPTEDEAAPAEDEAAPAEDEATPAEDEAAPAEDEATPAGDEAAPAEQEDVKEADTPVAPAVPDLPALPDLPSPPVADAAASPIIPSAPVRLPPPADVKLHGFVGFDWQPYLEPMSGAVDSVVQLRVAPRLEARFQFLRALAEIEYRHDFVDPGRNRFILREARAGLRWSGLRIEGGALLERWGKLDVFSPTDNLVANDYEDLFAPEALPVPGFLVGYARGPISAEFVLLPAFRPSRFRGGSVSRWDISRFLPSTQELPAFLGQTTVVDNKYEVFLPSVLDGDAEMGRGIELGGRVDLTLPVFDLGVSFLYTRDRLPTYTAYKTLNSEEDLDGDLFPDILSGAAARIEVTPHHRRLWIPGVDLAAVLGPVVLKGEAAFFATEDPGQTQCIVDDPYVKYGFGAELVLSNLVGDFDLAVRAQYNGDVTLPPTTQAGADRFTANLHYPGGNEGGNHDKGCHAVSYAADQAEAEITDYATGYFGSPEQRHPFSHGFFLNVNLAFTRAITLDLRAFFDVAGDALLMPRFSVLLLDRLDLTVGALVVLATGEDTLFTPYGDNHRLELGVRYAF